MGLLSSIFNPTKIPLFLVTLDALGTIYKFRQPVAVQYQQVAKKCGLKANIDLKELDGAFKSSFKHHNTLYPNYGKGKLENPEVWWDLVVTQAFGQVVEGGKSALPRDLGSALYKHFSSGAAYEPFSDVKPFLQSMAALKKQFTDPDGPIVLTGVVTNSDPRVAVVLRDMGFRVGPAMIPTLRDITNKAKDDLSNISTFKVKSIYKDFYDINNDFDVLSTSFHAGVEKPEAGIWDHTEYLIGPTTLSRGEQNVEPGGSLETLSKMASVIRYQVDDKRMMRIHIGDEYSKDYLGATGAGWEALHLARGNEVRELGRDVKVVKSLDEVAMILNIMSNEFFYQTET